MTVDEVVRMMGELGFSPYEARVYYTLLQRSPLNGNEVARQSGVPTSKVYETLDRLRGKRALLVYESDPVRYAPVPYRDLLTSYTDHVKRTVEQVSRSLADVAVDTDMRLTWALAGAGNMVESLGNGIRHATSTLALLLTPAAADRLAADLADALHRGVRLELVLTGEPLGKLPAVQRLVRHNPPDWACRLCVVVGDDTETVLADLLDADATGVWTHQRAITALARSHLRSVLDAPV